MFDEGMSKGAENIPEDTPQLPLLSPLFTLIVNPEKGVRLYIF
jgi:hypothetical protein